MVIVFFGKNARIYVYIYIYDIFNFFGYQCYRNAWCELGSSDSRSVIGVCHIQLSTQVVFGQSTDQSWVPCTSCTYLSIWWVCIIKLHITSSTAQGGGGSFKNRKPIGEVGCCESRMADRSHWWTERCLRSPLFLSFSLCFSIFLWESTHLPTDLSVYLSICLSVYLSPYLSIYLPI